MFAVYFIAFAGPMPKSQLFWDRHADERGEWILKFLGQFGLLILRVIPRATAARGSSVGEREGEVAIKGRIVLAACRRDCQRANERGADEVLLARRSFSEGRFVFGFHVFAFASEFAWII
jgi:hypothetical protein